jgi:hypothetical protein
MIFGCTLLKLCVTSPIWLESFFHLLPLSDMSQFNLYKAVKICAEQLIKYRPLPIVLWKTILTNLFYTEQQRIWWTGKQSETKGCTLCVTSPIWLESFSHLLPLSDMSRRVRPLVQRHLRISCNIFIGLFSWDHWSKGDVSFIKISLNLHNSICIKQRKFE